MIFQVSSASVCNVGMSFVMLIIKQHLHLETAIQKLLNNGYRQKRNLHSENSINAAECDLANSVTVSENDWTNRQFSFLSPVVYILFTLAIGTLTSLPYLS